MTPILFSKTETAFTSNGIGRLVDCISCTVTEERNGIYECEFQYPINGKYYQEMIANGGIIGVIHDDNHDIQPFDIYKSEAPIEGVVTFYAHHISYRLNNIILQPFTASSAAGAITAISANSVNTNPFTFSTDKNVNAQFTLDHPASVRSILFGTEGSLLDIYGTAEFKFDKFSVQMLTHRGTNTGVTVRYGKNMTGLEETIDDSGTYNEIAPYWTDGVEYVFANPLIVQPTTPITPGKPVALDISDKFQEKPTSAQVGAMAQSILDGTTPWNRDRNLKVNFIALWQSPEYENVATIQHVSLCDTVSVYYTQLGIVAETEKVVRVVFNVLSERYEEIELGTLSDSFVAIESGSGNENGSIIYDINTLKRKNGAIIEPTGDSTDRRDEILDKLANFGYCEFIKGDYYISTAIELESGQTVKGCGKKSVLKKLGNTNDAFFSVVNDAQNVTIKDLYFTGPNQSKPVSENTGVGKIGIYVENKSGMVTIENCHFNGFNRAGILCASGFDWLRSVNVTNCSFLFCNYGIYFAQYGEFGNVTNCNFLSNYYGALVIGGNNKFADCGFDANAVGFVLYDDSGSPTNDGHGSVLGCTFCHNTSRAIAISNIDNGFTFGSCNIFYGDIYISNSRGILFDNCIVMGNKSVSDHTNFVINNCPGLISITDCCGTNSFTITKTSSDYVFSKNNKTRDGAVIAAGDRYLQSGQVTGNATAAGGYTDKAVTFSPAFPSVPHVQVTPTTDLSGTSLETGKVNYMIGSITTSGFTIRTYNNGSISRTGTYNWVAFINE